MRDEQIERELNRIGLNGGHAFRALTLVAQGLYFGSQALELGVTRGVVAERNHRLRLGDDM